MVQCNFSDVLPILLLKELCQEWEKKKEAEKKYPDFYRAVHAVAFSTGTKLKTRVQVLNKVCLFKHVFKYNVYIINLINKLAPYNVSLTILFVHTAMYITIVNIKVW